MYAWYAFDDNRPSSWISLSASPAALAEVADPLWNECPEYAPLSTSCPSSSHRCWTRYSCVNASLPGPSPGGRAKRGASGAKVGQSA